MSKWSLTAVIILQYIVTGDIYDINHAFSLEFM
jgi:hypothetical protein